MPVKALPLLRRGGSGEAGAVAAFHAVRGKRELADRQHRAIHGGQREVHLAAIVLENPQCRGLGGQPFRMRLRIARHGADEHEKATTDGPGDPAIDRDGGLGHSLDDGAQGSSAVSPRRT